MGGTWQARWFEPPWVCRKPFWLGSRPMSGSSCMASSHASVASGGMLPMGSSSRRLLNKSIQISVANSTASKFPVLALQCLQIRSHVVGPPAGCDLGRLHSLAHRLARAHDLGRDRHDRCPAGGMFMPVIQHQPDGALPGRACSTSRSWRPHSLRRWSLRQTRAVHVA